MPLKRKGNVCIMRALGLMRLRKRLMIEKTKSILNYN
jgi:hypothetical protein